MRKYVITFKMYFKAESNEEAEVKRQWWKTYLNSLPIPLNAPKGIENGIRFREDTHSYS